MTNDRCFQSQEVKGCCDVCNKPATLMHLPKRPLGFYCDQHCPICSDHFDVMEMMNRESAVCLVARVRAGIDDERLAG